MSTKKYKDYTDSWKTNRDKKREPKQGKFWCIRCDHYLVHEGSKCPYCGWRNKPVKRNKK